METNEPREYDYPDSEPEQLTFAYVLNSLALCGIALKNFAQERLDKYLGPPDPR